jgi:hypothetical protein
MEYSYSSDMFEEDSPYYKRLAPIYHSDNIDHRVYAYKEKAFQRLACWRARVDRHDRLRPITLCYVE